MINEKNPGKEVSEITAPLYLCCYDDFGQLIRWIAGPCKEVAAGPGETLGPRDCGFLVLATAQFHKAV